MFRKWKTLWICAEMFATFIQILHVLHVYQTFFLHVITCKKHTQLHVRKITCKANEGREVPLETHPRQSAADQGRQSVAAALAPGRWL